MRRFFQLLSIGLAVLFPRVALAGATGEVRFNRDVRPLLSENCFACHGPEARRKAGLRLDTREGTTAELASGSGRALVPGDPSQSVLLRRITDKDPTHRMPPASSRKKLTDKQVELLRCWIKQGAKYEGHWAFTPPARPALPKVSDPAWARNAIDLFILARLDQEGLKPAPEAPRATLLRRVTLDLTGLPPTPREVEAFLADTAPDAYERVVERLLASPRCGERLALLWLDLARYADTNGYNNDEERTMWPWRDWVLGAFNGNLPYDRFLTEQLAGDLLPGATLAQRVATGFGRNHVITTEGGIIPEEYRVEYVADRVHTTTTVFLGLSLGCARCHDHKFDPFSTRDYYRFFAYFNNIEDQTVGYNGGAAARPYLKVPGPGQQAELDHLDRRLAEIEKRRERRAGEVDLALPAWTISRVYLDTVDPECRRLKAEAKELAGRRAALDKSIPRTMVMAELPTPRKTHILKRGQYDAPGPVVTAGLPDGLLPLPKGSPANRLGLARWLTDPAHPLTARVAVNRWWELLLGAGLVETSEDFGSQGAWPSHPELLDWLATEFVRTAWDVKGALRLLVTSATYRQSSSISKELRERDPKNRLLARGPRVRLPAETVRDNALAVSGLLREKLGGPSVKPYQPPGLWEDVSVERRESYKPDAGAGLYRRSLYTYWKRTCPPPGMTALDAPDRETCTVRRARTNTPMQALLLLNDPTYLEAARVLAERMMSEAGPASDTRLIRGFLLVLGRPPADAERRVLQGIYQQALSRFRGDPKAAARFLAAGRAPRAVGLDPPELAAWSVVASLLLNLDEAITKE
jgi:hypothetical protein